MSDGVSIDIQTKGEGADALRVCRVELDPKHAGRDVTFEILRHAEVKDSSPVHETQTLFKHGFKARAGAVEEFEITGLSEDMYSYEGEQVHVQLQVRVVVDDGYIFDTTVKRAFDVPLFREPRAGGCAKHIVDKEDAYDFSRNLAALPAVQATKVKTVAGTVGAIAVTNFVVAGHDLLSADKDVWLYSIPGPPLAVLTFFATLIAAIFIYWYVYRALESYLTLKVAPPAGGFQPGKTYRLGDLFSAKATAELRNIEVWLVACNNENGQYVRGSGSNRRTVSFTSPVRGVAIFKKNIEWVPRGSDLATYCDDEVDMTKLFETLYPPQMVGKNHGVGIRCEIQIIHPEYVDKKDAFPESAFDRRHFLEGESVWA